MGRKHRNVRKNRGARACASKNPPKVQPPAPPPPANEPARRLYSHVVVPPHLRKYRFDNDSLREAVNQYINANENDYTEKGLRYRYEEECGCNDPQCHYNWCPVCNSERSAAEEERRYRDWVWRTLKCVGLEEPVTEHSGAMDAVIAHYGPIEEWDVSKVTNMRELFRCVERFNADLSKWDVSNVTDMCCMFECAFVFNCDLSAWDVSNVTNMRGMFFGAERFNGDLSKWDVSNVTDMSHMFDGAGAFKGDLSKWDVSKVTNTKSMFNGAESFNGDLSKWNVSNVTDMSYMFCNARTFNGDLSKWQMHVPKMMQWRPGPYKHEMFIGADSFDGALPRKALEHLIRIRDTTRGAFHGPTPARWLWRLVRYSIRPHVLARLAAYHLMELGARPDAEGNAPRGAIEAFCEDFSESCAWWSES